MKLLIILGTMILSLSTFAESITDCSNPSATVRWKIGTGESLAYLTYKGFVTGDLEVPLEMLTIKRFDEKTIDLKTRDLKCTRSETVRHYTMRVEITPSEKTPDVLGSYFPEKVIKALVLCEERNSFRYDCAKDL